MQLSKKETQPHMAYWLMVLLPVAAGVGCGLPTSWETRHERIEITSDGIETLTLKTHNGNLHVRAVEEPGAVIEVTATIEAGASNAEEVLACLDAIEIVVSDVDSGAQAISWRWRVGRQSGWSAKVSFEAVVPSRLGVVAETHNGAIDVNGVTGNCRLESHNGRIRTLVSGTSLSAKTHNGAIFAQTAAADVVLVTHNGAVEAVLTSNDALNGKIVSHNGAITVAINPSCSTKISSRTKNGRIRSTLSLEDEDSDRKSISGQLGTGAGTLAVATRNGSITLRAADATPEPSQTASPQTSQAEPEQPASEAPPVETSGHEEDEAETVESTEVSETDEPEDAPDEADASESDHSDEEASEPSDE